MAKVRCARCGEIFALQQGEIQVCPRCGCRMRVNRKPQATRPAAESADIGRAAPAPRFADVPAPAPEADEYETLRREYMDMMRSKLSGKPAEGDGVYLSREEYNALVAKKASEASSITVAPVQPAVTEPAVAPAKAEEAPYEEPRSGNNFDPYTGEPLNKPQQSVEAYEYCRQPAEDEAEDEPARAPVKTDKKGKIFGWVAFLFAVGAGVLSALLLLFEAYRDGTKGWDLLVPEGGWLDIQFPFNPVIAVCLFLPALLAVFSLISAIRQGKGGKFFLFALYLIAGAALLILPFISQLSDGLVDTFKFDYIIDAIRDNGIVTLIAAGLCFAACLTSLIAGILNKSRKRRRLEAEYSED